MYSWRDFASQFKKNSKDHDYKKMQLAKEMDLTQEIFTDPDYTK